MPNSMSLSEFMGSKPAGTMARTPEQADQIISQVEKATNHTLTDQERQQMHTDLMNGAKVDIPGVSTSEDSTPKSSMSLQEFAGTSKIQTPNQPATDTSTSTSTDPNSSPVETFGQFAGDVKDSAEGLGIAGAHAFGRIWQGLKRTWDLRDQKLIPSRKMTPAEQTVAKKLNLDSTTSPGEWSDMSPVSSQETQAQLDQRASEHPELYHESAYDKAHGISDMSESIGNIPSLWGEQSAPAQFLSSEINKPDAERKRYDLVHSYMDLTHIVNSPDHYPAVSVQAAKQKLATLNKQYKVQQEESNKSVVQRLKDMKDAMEKNPGEAALSLAKGIVADPELLWAPAGAAGDLGKAADSIRAGVSEAESASRLAKVAKMTKDIAKHTAEGATINASIDLAQQNGNVGPVDFNEMKAAGAVGAIMTVAGAGAGAAAHGLGLMGHMLVDGVRSRLRWPRTSDAKAQGMYEDAVKGHANYDAAVEEALDPNSPVPPTVKEQIEASLGIRNEQEAKDYLKQRQKDIKAAFADDSEYADYSKFVADSKAKLHAALEQAKQEQETRDQAHEAIQHQTADQRKQQFQQEFEKAQQARDQADMNDLHTQALAEDKARTAQANMDAEDALLKAYGGHDVPAIKQAMAAAARRDASRNIPKWQRGTTKLDMLSHLGLAGLGSALGYALSPQQQKVGTSILGGLAGFGLPFFMRGDLSDLPRRMKKEGGMFSGIGSRTADTPKLREADQLEKTLLANGEPKEKVNEKVRQATGWFRGHDGHWRYEISDHGARLDTHAVKDLRDGSAPKTQAGNPVLPLPDVLHHADLYEAYPSLRDYRVVMKSMSPDIIAQHDRDQKIIFLNKNKAYSALRNHPESIESAILHEVQHAVQYKEGHATGGSYDRFIAPIQGISQELVDRFDEYKKKYGLHDPRTQKVGALLKKVLDNAYNQYTRLAGEVEARNTQSRMGLRPETRRQVPPTETQDVPNKKIIRNAPQQVSTMPYYEAMQKSGVANENGDLHGMTLDADKLPHEDMVVNAAQHGDQKAFMLLFHHYWPRLVRSMRGLARVIGPRLGVDAEDLAQRAFHKAFANIDKFNGDSSFYTWLYRIAHNEGLMTNRMLDSRVDTTSMYNSPGESGADGEGNSPVKSSVEQASHDVADPEAMAAAHQTQEAVQKSLDTMPKDYAQAVRLIDIQGHSLAEAAALEGVPTGTMASRLGRGREIVQRTLKRQIAAGTHPVLGNADAARGVPRGQRGQADTKLLGHVALASLGAGVGAYLANQNKLAGAIAGSLGGLGLGHLYKNGLVEGLDKAVGVMSTRVRKISPELHGRWARFEHDAIKHTHHRIVKVAPFLRELKKIHGPVRGALERAILTNDPEVTSRIIKAIDNPKLTKGWHDVRDVLDDLRDKLMHLGRFRKGLTDYFPRIVVDQEGLLNALGKERKSRIEQALHEANAKAVRKTGQGLSDIDRSKIINNMMMQPDDRSGMPGFAMNRGVEEITPELMKYYASPAESLHSYIRAATHDIEKAKFFGKDLHTVERGGKSYTHDDLSIGNVVQRMMNEDGLSEQQAKDLSSMLKARFVEGERASGKLVQSVKDIGNAGLLGNPVSAITQFGDPVISLFTQGIKPTIATVVRQLTGRKTVSVHDLGLTDHIAEEFASTRKTAKFVQKTFRYGLFAAVDHTGKNTVLGSALHKMRGWAKTPKGIEKLRQEYSPLMGNKFHKFVNDLKTKTNSDEVTSALLQELSQSQPVTKFELPEQYLKHPNGRMLYWLHTFQIKMFDLARRHVYDEIKKGHVVKATKNLIGLGIVLGLGGASTSAVQSFILGKPIDASMASIISNAFKAYGLSMYTLDKSFGVSKRQALLRRAQGERGRATAAHPLQAVQEAVLPPADMFEQILTADPKAVRYIPIIGRFLYQYEVKPSEAADRKKSDKRFKERNRDLIERAREMSRERRDSQ